MKYYIADLHIGHENVIKHDGRPFKDAAQMAHESAVRCLFSGIYTVHHFLR